MRIPESGKFVLVESGILGFGIRNSAQGIRNPSNDSNPEIQYLESWIHSVESRIVLDYSHAATCLACFSSHIYTKNNKYNYYTL